MLRSSVIQLGDFTLFSSRALKTVRRLNRRWGIFLRQCEAIGVTSLGIISVAGTFMGAVLGYQLYISFKIFGAEALLGGTVGVSLFREMAPVFTAIMVTGRAGASIAAEIGTMRITEQIDALEVMAVDPYEFLITPRVTAAVLMMPILALFFAGIGSLSSALVACGMMGLDASIYWDQYARWVDQIDLIHILSKSASFGLVLSLIACYSGFKAQGGAGAVGAATRRTVVLSLLAILLVDYLLTSLLPYRLSGLVAH